VFEPLAAMFFGGWLIDAQWTTEASGLRAAIARLLDVRTLRRQTSGGLDTAREALVTPVCAL